MADEEDAAGDAKIRNRYGASWRNEEALAGDARE
jgi:hypothetical protein